MRDLPTIAATLALSLTVAACYVAPAPVAVGTYQPVPPLQQEVIPPAPSTTVVWEPGHWNWNGARYVWVPGHYLERTAAGEHWVHGHWAQRNGVWEWMPGHWA